MPVALPAARRPRLGLHRAAAMVALYCIGRLLFAAAMWCGDIADGLDRRT